MANILNMRPRNGKEGGGGGGSNGPGDDEVAGGRARAKKAPPPPPPSTLGTPLRHAQRAEAVRHARVDLGLGIDEVGADVLEPALHGAHERVASIQRGEVHVRLDLQEIPFR